MKASEYIEAIESVVPGIAQRAEEAETLRRIPDDTIRELRENGLLKALQPARYGGFELDPLTFYRAIGRIGEACGSTAWVFGILGVHPWQLGLFPDAAQREVWGEDDTTLVASTYAPVGKVKPVEGGFELSGRWPWSSGTDHCSWVLLGGINAHNRGEFDMRTFLLPRSDYEIIDTWRAVGLKGTGTNDILVKSAFVPEHRTLSFADMGRCDCPGNAVNPSTLYRLPFASVFATAIAAAALGMADGILRIYRDLLGERFKIAYGEAAREDPHSQVKLAQAHSMVDAAWQQLEQNVSAVADAAKRGEAASLLDRTRLRHDQAYGVSRAIEAADICFESSGGSVLRDGHPLQRFWRDLHAARQHAINDYERAAGLYGRALLGIDVSREPMV
ncbi:MAG: flavin-dependent monooxygenase [Myxococcota bacterium]|nr:flavin-dependent monooxygenase [Myxococcota bacterium]